jgi:RNA polymerase sigma factor (sigma-70 family)
VEQWPSTHGSLLVRVRDLSDRDAWTSFVQVYAPVVYRYARRHGLQDADAADLSQDILRRVAGAIQEFRYDRQRGSFRGWLFTVTRNALQNFLTGSRRRSATLATYARQLSASPADEQSDDSQIWDEEYERQLLAKAAEYVRPRFSATTWQAFWQTAVEGKSAPEISQALGISVGALYVARSRVLAKLRLEIERLETEGL